MLDRIMAAAQYIKENFTIQPKVAVILGSGLNDYADTFEEVESIPYENIRGFYASNIIGHESKLVAGYKHGAAILAMKGRFHCYEGNTPQQAAFPIWVMRKLGIEILIVTNAVGGINKSYQPGDFVVIKDHLNMPAYNPLIGHNIEELGPRFPDMTNAYDPELRNKLHLAGKSIGLSLQEGVYAMMSGPSFETPAEIKMLGIVGADMVGMSTVPEVIAARHCGIKVAGISFVSNYAAGICEHALTHQEVLENASKKSAQFTDLIDAFLKQL